MILKKRSEKESAFISVDFNVVADIGSIFLCIKDAVMQSSGSITYTTIGRFYSENTRKKHINWAKENDIKPPKETYESKMIKVSMISIKTGEILEKFKSLSDACRFLNKTINFSSTIKLACIGKRKTALGYKWEITKEK